MACCTLAMQAQMAGTGTAEDPYQVSSADDLFDLRVNLSAHYKLVNDIDLVEWIAEESPTTGWNPIPGLSGVLDGDGHCISGLSINKPTKDNIGLFSSCSGTIKNIRLRNAEIVGNKNTGCLVGSLTGSIENIELNGIHVQGASCTGGIVGTVNWEVNNPRSVKGVAIQDAEINGTSNVGGFVGYVSNSSGWAVPPQRLTEDYESYNVTVRGTSDYVGGVFGYSDNLKVQNVKIVKEYVEGVNYVGGATGAASSLCNITLVHPIIHATNYVGGLTGLKLYKGNMTESANENGIRWNFVIGGTISGNDCVGGIMGGVNARSFYNYFVNGNYASSAITARNRIGGIAGSLESEYYPIGGSGHQQAHVSCNRSDCTLVGDSAVGGIVGYLQVTPTNFISGTKTKYDAGVADATLNQNITTGSIMSQKLLGGILACVGSTSFRGTLSANICAVDKLASVTDMPYRIFQTWEEDNNYAAASTVVSSRSEDVAIEEGMANGISYSLRNLKRKNTYLGIGYNFDSDGAYWAIEEGKTLPYIKLQSASPTVTSCIGGRKAVISGTAEEDGKIYVMVGDRLIEGTISDGQWEVEIGNVEEGTVIKVSAEAVDMQPSIAVTTVAATPVEDRVVLSENATSLPETSDGPVDVRLNRTLRGGCWQTIVLPFDATAEQVKAAWGEDVRLAEFTAWNSEEDEDGNIVGLRLNFTSATEIAANTPMLICTSEDFTTATFDGVVVAPEEEPIVQVGKKKAERGYFVGTYTAGTPVPENDLFLSGNRFYYSDGTVTMQGYRAYFELMDVLANVENAAVKLNLDNDMIFTSVDGLTSKQTAKCDNTIYDFTGRKVSAARRGVFIMNGKKILVK